MPTRIGLVALLATALIAPAAATAAPWKLVSPNNEDNIDQASLARTPDGVLHVIYATKGEQAIFHTGISTAGKVGATTPVQQGWATIASVPDLVTQPDGSLRAFFGGLHSTTTGDPNNDFNTATSSDGGAAWTLFPGPVVKGDAAYASDAGVALLPDGTPLISFGGTGTGTFVHRGLDPGTPNFPVKTPSGLCCTYQPDVAVDQSGSADIAFFSNATGDEGLWVQDLDRGTGQPVGGPVRVPGSSTLFDGKQTAVQQLWRTQIVARPGGGVWIAGSEGYPTANRPYVYKVGSSKQIRLGTTLGSEAITGLTADPEGRLWGFWIDRNSGHPVILARRSSAKNPAKFASFVLAGAPPKVDSCYSIKGDAQAGKLDLVALCGNTAGIGHWHTQVNPGLDVGASPSKVNGKKGSTVKFTVTDPDPVKGAKLKGGGDSATTDKNGHATLDLGPTKKKSISVAVTHAGYVSTIRVLLVKH